MRKNVLRYLLAMSLITPLVPVSIVNAANTYTDEEHQIAIEYEKQQEEREWKENYELLEYSSSSNYIEYSFADEYKMDLSGNDMYIWVTDYSNDKIDFDNVRPCVTREDGSEVSTSVIGKVHETPSTIVYHVQKNTDEEWSYMWAISLTSVDGNEEIEKELQERDWYKAGGSVLRYSSNLSGYIYKADYNNADKKIYIYINPVNGWPNYNYKYNIKLTRDRSGYDYIETYTNVQMGEGYMFEVPYNPETYGESIIYAHIERSGISSAATFSTQIFVNNYDDTVYGNNDIYIRGTELTSAILYRRFLTTKLNSDSIGTTLLDTVGVKLVDSEETIVASGTLSKTDADVEGIRYYGAVDELDLYVGDITAQTSLSPGEYLVKYDNGQGVELDFSYHDQKLYVMDENQNYVNEVYPVEWISGSDSFVLRVSGFWNEAFDPDKLDVILANSTFNLPGTTQVEVIKVDSPKESYYSNNYPTDIYLKVTNESLSEYTVCYSKIYYDGVELPLVKGYNNSSIFGFILYSRVDDKMMIVNGYGNSVFGFYQEGYNGETFTVNFYETAGTIPVKSVNITMNDNYYNLTSQDLAGLSINTQNKEYVVEILDSNGRCVCVNTAYLHDFTGIYMATEPEDDIVVGETYQMRAVDTTQSVITWESSDESVARVNADGLVTAVSEGTAIISAASSNYSVSKEVSVVADVVDARLVGATVTLDDKIGLNFHMQLGNSIINDENAYLLITLPDGEHIKSAVSEASKDLEKGTYVFSCKFAAKEMHDSVTIRMVTSYEDGNVYTYSVKEYADYILNSSNYTAADKKLAKAMLNYGIYAQKYFDYNADDLIGDEMVSVNENELSDFKASVDSTGAMAGVSYYGSSLILDSGVVVRHYFTIDKEVVKNIPSGMTKTNNGDYYYTETSGVPVTKFATLVNDVICGYNITYCPLSYVYTVISNENFEKDENLLNLLQAMYYYYMATIGY